MTPTTPIPLISCIMPTYNRRPFIPHAIRYFLRQDYENKELIIIDDGTDPVKDLVPDLPNIRYYRQETKISLGAKLNLACEYAEGNLIAHWDDDDWYAPRRLSYQREALKNEKIEMCGINNLLYYDLRNQQAYNYIYPTDQRAWLLGSSLFYRKQFWKLHPFEDINVGMDGLFVWKTTPDRIINHPDPTFAVHMIHSSNISPKKTDNAWWHPFPAGKIQEIMGPDWLSYCNNGRSDVPIQPMTQVNTIIPAPDHIKASHFYRSQTSDRAQNSDRSAPLRNIYACLVHENPDCILDLVRNLHYHDPASIIILYNGGSNPGLLSDITSYEQWGAVVYPYPSPLRWGYLHNFAIQCMEFALENFPFDTLTIVDSDQLAIRSGYCKYLGDYLAPLSNIGMLSSMPDRVSEGNTQIHPAIQAFREINLWRPFLQQYRDGESKFVHWTFWPSTVFTHDAARDLTSLFKTNKQLNDILSRSQIWASEEIILPTLVRLLGYEIAANPCSYDYVKYKKTFTANELDCAFNAKDAYWIHPIQRIQNDPLRVHIRQRCDQYSVEGKGVSSQSNPSYDRLLTMTLLNRIRKVEGWLNDREGDLLINTAMAVCKEMPAQAAIVEIGSYHGKSTILLGNIVRSFSPGRRIYAIDPHDGQLGAADQGLQSYPPSFEKFTTNIRNEGLTEMIKIIRARPVNVALEEPIALLFIDGLHDYQNVAADFRRFSPRLLAGGYVVFHDYAEYYPGVQRFVHELLTEGGYSMVHLMESLIVLRKALTDEAATGAKDDTKQVFQYQNAIS